MRTPEDPRCPLRQNGTADDSGTSLVEVLLATSLLSAIAFVCVPMLRFATRAAAAGSPAVTHAELARFADTCMAGREGLLPWHELLTSSAPLTVVWPERLDSPRVRVVALPRHDESERTWIAFRCDPWLVLRHLSPEHIATLLGGAKGAGAIEEAGS